MKLLRRDQLVLLVFILQPFLSESVLSADFPALKWTVSDDTLSTPFGAIIDVGVDTAGVVYLLDRQACVVHRIDVDGTELPSWGRRGQGPGEFKLPSLLVVYPFGGCVVIPDFNAPSVCFMPDGDICDGPDLTIIRDRFVMTHFVGTARADNDGRIHVVASTTERAFDPASPDPGALSVFRMTPGEATTVTLFTDTEKMCDESSVDVSGFRGPFMPRCWDVNNEGKIIYADPTGKYRVVIGHPVDGKNITIDLPVADTDPIELDRVAESMGRSTNDIALIADVLWVGRDHFIVKPSATVSGPTFTQGGIVEVFDTSGNSYGRYSLYDDVDGTYDSLFLSRGHMVIVEGGWSARRASVGIESVAPDGSEPDVIRVHLYDLRMN